jgi:hypothetical protein
MVTETQLLEAILDSQNRCNNLVGAAFNELRSQQSQPVSSIDQWKEANPQLSKRCGANAAKLTRILNHYLDNLLEAVENLDEGGSQFEVRDFIDTYGQSFIQLNGVLHILAQLSS